MATISGIPRLPLRFAQGRSRNDTGWLAAIRLSFRGVQPRGIPAATTSSGLCGVWLDDGFEDARRPSEDGLGVLLGLQGFRVALA